MLLQPHSDEKKRLTIILASPNHIYTIIEKSHSFSKIESFALQNYCFCSTQMSLLVS